MKDQCKVPSFLILILLVFTGLVSSHSYSIEVSINPTQESLISGHHSPETQAISSKYEQKLVGVVSCTKRGLFHAVTIEELKDNFLFSTFLFIANYQLDILRPPISSPS